MDRSTDLEEKLNSIDKKLDLLNELSGKVDAISADVDDIQEDMDDVSNNAARVSLQRARTVFIGIVALIMALGQFSEAVSLIGDGWRSIKSQFTNSVEYNALAKLHVGNTEPYAQSLFGEPQVSRKITDNITANYYYQKKMLLTLFIKDARISAFTVLALKEGFSPKVNTVTNKNLTLGNFTYSEYPAMPTLYLDDNSKSDSFYLESLEPGQVGLHFKRYLGNIRYGTGQLSPLIQTFYKLDLTGADTKQLAKTQKKLRAAVKPNFYGSGEIGIELVEKSLLTDAEFTNYFIAQK